MWDLPGPGLEPVSPALAGRFSTTAPPGKSWRPVLACASVVTDTVMQVRCVPQHISNVLPTLEAQRGIPEDLAKLTLKL